MPATPEVLAHFRRHAPVYDATRWITLHGRRRLLRHLPLSPGQRVLDIGCGTGAAAARIADRIGPEGHVLALDPSPAMLARARHRLCRRQNTSLFGGTLRDLPRDTPPFDLALFSYSLSMTADPFAAIDRACTLLRPGAVLAAVDFHQLHGPLARAVFARYPVHPDPELAVRLRSRCTPHLTWYTRRSPWRLWSWFLFVGRCPS